jgi:DNA-binding beta-propeller fold protein YncE
MSYASVIDTATNTVEAATILVGTSPNGIAVNPDGTHAYVANQSASRAKDEFYPAIVQLVAPVTSQDYATWLVGATVLCGSFPHGTLLTKTTTVPYVGWQSDCSIGLRLLIVKGFSPRLRI